MKSEYWFTEKKIGDFLRGALAEKICELMHRELKCQIYRTGHEHLYPHLIDTSIALRKLRYKIDPSKLLRDLEDMQIFADQPPANIKELMSMKPLEQSVIASNPDFTIVYPTGVIKQIEVKYRHDGKFTQEELKKYKELKVCPDIFVVMKKPPYLRILFLGKNIDLHDFDGMDKSKLKEFLKKIDVDKIENEYIDLAEDEKGIHSMAHFISDSFTYPKSILIKYRDIISQINWDSLYLKEEQSEVDQNDTTT